MKKLFICLLFTTFNFFVIAQKINYSLYPIEILPDKAYLYENYNKYLDEDYIITFSINYPEDRLSETVPFWIEKKKTFVDSGYLYDEYEDKTCYYILEGKGFYASIKNRNDTITKEILSQEQKEERNIFLQKKEGTYHHPFESDLHGWGKLYFADDGIKTIRASSHLKESTVTYSPENLCRRFYVETGDDPGRLSFDYITPPWVEGVNGYGIGEYLDIEFKKPSDEIQILNGFVDFDRQYLFKENSRIKTIVIESKTPEFSKTYELLDLVKFSVIKLPQNTDSIRITIKDVYKGDKYDDTCLTAIVVTDCDKPTFEENVRKIQTMLNNSKYKKEIEKFKKYN